eukprot:959854_1
MCLDGTFIGDEAIYMMVKANILRIKPECTIDAKHMCNIAAADMFINGAIECNKLLLSMNTLSIASKQLHIWSEVRIEFKDIKEQILSNDGEIEIKPYEDKAYKEQTDCVLSADQSNKTISIQHYQITTKMNCKLNIMNLTEAQMDHCKIECYDICLRKINRMRCNDQTKIDSIHLFDCNEMDDFMMNQSTLVMKKHQTIVNVNNSFSMDASSLIECSDQYIEIKSAHEIQLNGKVNIGQNCQFIAHSTQTLNTSETCRFESESVYLNHNEAGIEEKKETNHESIVTQYMNAKPKDKHYVYLQCDKRMNIDGEFRGVHALYMMNCNETIQIGGANCAFDAYVLFVKCKADIYFANACNMNGECYFECPNDLTILKNAQIQSRVKLTMSKANNVTIQSPSVFVDAMYVRKIKNTLRLDEEAAIEYKDIFETQDVSRFEMDSNSKLSNTCDDASDANGYGTRRCWIQTNKSFLMNQRSAITAEFEDFKIQCDSYGGKVDIRGDITIKQLCLFRIISYNLDIAAGATLTSELASMHADKTKKLKEKTPKKQAFTKHDFEEGTSQILNDVTEDHHLHLFATNNTTLSGRIQALNGLVIIDSMNHIAMIQNGYIKAD